MDWLDLEGRLRRITDSEAERIQELHELLVAAVEQGDADAAENVIGQHFVDQYHFLAE